MKLKEIPDYLSGVRIRKSSWNDPNSYIFFDGYCWRDHQGYPYSMTHHLGELDMWSIYI